MIYNIFDRLLPRYNQSTGNPKYVTDQDEREGIGSLHVELKVELAFIHGRDGKFERIGLKVFQDDIPLKYCRATELELFRAFEKVITEDSEGKSNDV